LKLIFLKQEKGNGEMSIGRKKYVDRKKYKPDSEDREKKAQVVTL